MGVENYLLSIDPLSRLFVAAFLVAGIPCLIFLMSVQKDAKLAVAAVAFIGSTLGVVTARNLLAFLIFWELTVLVACYLIVRGGMVSSGGNAARAGRIARPGPFDDGTVPAGCTGFAVAYRYFVVQIVAGASLFFAIAIQHAIHGSFAMAPVAPEAVPFLLVAFLVKAAVVPFHIWVPLTYPSVSPAVAVVLSAYSTKIGVYAFARFLPAVPWIAYAGAVMSLFGVVMALRQRTARRLLAYHLVSQVGYMLAGIGLGTELGIGGGTLHMMNNMIYKSLLFMVAGAVLYRMGTDVLARVGGLGRSMPLTLVAGLIGAAAIAGLPPLNGYVSKTLLKAATEGHAFLQGALFLAGIGTALSFTKFIWYLFFDKQPSESPVCNTTPEMPLGACLAMGVLSVLCLVQGLFYPRFLAMASATVPESVYSAGSVLLGIAPVVIGVALFALNRRAARPLAGRVLAQTFGFLAPYARREGMVATDPSRCAAQAKAPPWDVDSVYAWLLHRALQFAHAIARRAKDDTQAYLLAITALLVGLVAYLAW